MTTPIDAHDLPPGWGYTPARIRARMIGDAAAEESSHRRRAIYQVAALRAEGCSWTEVERITGINLYDYLALLRRRNTLDRGKAA